MANEVHALSYELFNSVYFLDFKSGEIWRMGKKVGDRSEYEIWRIEEDGIFPTDRKSSIDTNVFLSRLNGGGGIVGDLDFFRGFVAGMEWQQKITMSNHRKAVRQSKTKAKTKRKETPA